MKHDNELFASLIILGLIAGAWLIDLGSGSKHVVPASVVSTSHVAHSIDVGYTTGGDVALISHDEQWTVVVSSGRFGVISAKTSPSMWARLKRDDSVTLEVTQGGISGFRYKAFVH